MYKAKDDIIGPKNIQGGFFCCFLFCFVLFQANTEKQLCPFEKSIKSETEMFKVENGDLLHSHQ